MPYSKDPKNDNTSPPAVREQAQPVVSEPAKKQKKGLFRTIFESAVSDEVTSLKDFAIDRIAAPIVQKAITDVSDVMRNAVNAFFYGKSFADNKQTNSSTTTPYGSYYMGSRPIGYSVPRSMGCAYGDIIVQTEQDARNVLNELNRLMQHNGVVSVFELYTTARYPTQYTDNDYGWTDIRAASYAPANGGGYLIKMPKPMPINYQ